MTANTPPQKAMANLSTDLRVRVAVAALLCALAVLYTAGVLFGAISGDRKIDAVHFALIVLTVLISAILVQPDLLERLKRLKLSGFELELLERVREKQAEQANQLEHIRLILPLLLPETERSHLFNLARGRTSGYRGNHSLRGELRRLRSIGLVSMEKGKHVEEVRDGLDFDIAEFAKLTPLGEHWVGWLGEMDETGNAVETESTEASGV